MKIFAVVVTYNGSQWIKKCIRSLLESSLDCTIVVIDNHSSDDTVSIIKKDFNMVHLLQQDKNLGFGKANNLGISLALEQGADFVFLLNQDAWIPADALKNLVDAAQQNPEYGILSPVHYFQEGVLDSLFKRYFNRYNKALLNDIEKQHFRQEIYPIEFVNAAIWLMTRESILKTGYFNPFYPHYGEDKDYGSRVQYHGFKVGVVTAAKGYHERNQTLFIDKQMPLKERIKRFHIISLAFASSVNKSFMLQFHAANQFLVLNILKAFFKLQINTFVAALTVFFRIYFNIGKILRIRKSNKQVFAYAPKP